MIIGLTGVMGSGKDTAADAILAEFPGFDRYALAGPIKDLAERWLGLNSDYNARGVKESLTAFRMDAEYFDCLDLIVYDMFKDLHHNMNMPMAKKVAKAIYDAVLKDNMYCNVNEGEVSAQVLVTTPRRIWQIIGTEGFRDTVSDTFWLDIAPTSNTIITDIRFPNEADHFLGWQTENAILEIKRTILVPQVGKVHQSEMGVPEESITKIIFNDGTIDQLGTEVKAFVEAHTAEYGYDMRVR